MQRRQTRSSTAKKSPEKPSTKSKTSSLRSLASFYSILAGACAASASLFAKNTVSPSSESLIHLTRVINVAGMIGCNVLMWAFFTRALRLSSSSVHATVLNVASNFCVTAFIGLFVFNEPLPPLWWFGASLILGGSCLLHQDAK